MPLDTEISFTSKLPKQLRELYKSYVLDAIEVGMESTSQNIELESFLNQFLPVILHSKLKTHRSQLNLKIVCAERRNGIRFFYEMVTRWLMPGHILNVSNYLSIDFKLPKISKIHTYTLYDLTLDQLTEEAWEAIIKNLPNLSSEIKLGVSSEYQGKLILESKGLGSEEKSTSIQEHITRLFQRHPEHFSADIFKFTQRFLVICDERFRLKRNSRHLRRLVTNLYAQHDKLRERKEQGSHKRYCLVKPMRTQIFSGGKFLPVLSVLVSYSFLRSNEHFEDKHLIKSIQEEVPNIETVPSSYFHFYSPDSNTHSFYTEIFKEGTQSFSHEELSWMRKELPKNLRERIERKQTQVFMPRNEEEVLRQILTLSNELRFVNDLPQVNISYENQEDEELSFNVVLARVLKPTTPPLKKLFHQPQIHVKYIPHSSKSVGKVRNRYPKEVSVFNLLVDKSIFIRKDHSLDLYQAREFIHENIKKAIGPYRDYNGGMISKQHEVLEKLKARITETSGYDYFLLEKLFFALEPPVMIPVLGDLPISSLYELFVECHENNLHLGNFHLMIDETHPEFLTFLATSEDPDYIESIQKSARHYHEIPMTIAWSSFKVFDIYHYGIILRSDDPSERLKFIQEIQDVGSEKNYENARG